MRLRNKGKLCFPYSILVEMLKERCSHQHKYVIHKHRLADQCQ